MKLSYYFKLSFRNLFRRKFRNIFTIISLAIAGILLGALLSLQAGFSNFLENQLSFLPPKDLVIVTPKAPDVKINFGGPTASDEPVEVNENAQTNFGFEIPLFKQEDVEKIKKVPGISEVDYSFDLTFTQKAIQLQGATKKYVALVTYNDLQTRDKIKLLSGRELNKNDQGVAIVSSKYLKVFNADNPNVLLGKQVTIDGQQLYNFEIIGVSDKSVKESPDYVIPYKDAVTMVRDDFGDPELYNTKFGSNLSVKIENENQAGEVAQKLKDLGYEATTAEEISDGISGVVEWFFRVLAIIGFLISALFIFSTMSVAVKDRTREIGIMKAVGATKGTIRLLFSTEAVLLGIISGTIAVVLSLSWFTIFNFYSHQSFLKDLPNVNILVISYTLPLIVIGVTSLVSLFSAFWPAFRASNIDPIKAIRNE